MIIIGSNRKLKREMPDSVVAEQMEPSLWKMTDRGVNKWKEL